MLTAVNHKGTILHELCTDLASMQERACIQYRALLIIHCLSWKNQMTNCTLAGWKLY